MKSKSKTEESKNVTEELKSSLGSGTHIVFSFDTTGSMAPCISDVRQKLKDLSSEMFQNIPGLKIGLIAHGDYCDNEKCVVALDLTNKLDRILDFLEKTPNTSGGDTPECYELALNTARQLSWPDEGGSLVLIGDATPHPPSYHLNKNHLDWKEELKELQAKGIKVFPMQCLGQYNPGNKFWKEVAELCQTPLLQLNSFEESTNNLAAVAYASGGEEVLDSYMRSSSAVRCSSLSADFMVNTTALRSFVEKEKEPEVEAKVTWYSKE